MPLYISLSLAIRHSQAQSLNLMKILSLTYTSNHLNML